MSEIKTEKDVASFNVFRLTTLPSLPGVSTLTSNEIHNDLRELQKLSYSSDTDSESSVKSENILVSNYPVKPRKTLQLPSIGDSDDYFTNKEISAEVNEALAFIKKLAITHKDLIDAEFQREELEMMYEAYEGNYKNEISSFKGSKTEQENYLRVIQAVLARSLKVHAMRSRQNTMYLSLYNALLDRKSCTSSLVQSLQDLKKDSYVRIVVTGTDKVVVFSIGQELLTPMGKGEIIAIDRAERKLTFKLGFGVMFSSFANAMHWNLSEEHLGVNSLSNLWERKVKHMLSVDSSYYSQVIELLGSRYDDSEATDNDDDSSETTEISVDGEDESVDGRNPQEMDDGNESVESKQSTNVKAILSTLNTIENEHNFFPLQYKQNSKITRASIRAILEEEKKQALNSTKTSVLPIALAPISALPAFIKKFKEPLSLQFIQDGMLVDLDALDTNSIPSCPLGTTGSLGWNGDLSNLRSELKALGDNVTQLEYKKLQLQSKLEQSRAESTRLSTETSNLRLGMFTRRIAHRNYLGAHGIHISTAPVAHPPKNVLKVSVNMNAQKAQTTAAVATADISKPTEENAKTSRASRVKVKSSDEQQPTHEPSNGNDDDSFVAKKNFQQVLTSTIMTSDRRKVKEDANKKRTNEETESKDETDTIDGVGNDNEQNSSQRKKAKKRRYI